MANEMFDELSDAEIKEQLVRRLERLREQVARTEQALEAFENPARRHKMNEEARANTAAAQKKRWANWRKENKK